MRSCSWKEHEVERFSETDRDRSRDRQPETHNKDTHTHFLTHRDGPTVRDKERQTWKQPVSERARTTEIDTEKQTEKGDRVTERQRAGRTTTRRQSLKQRKFSQTM